MPNYNVGDGCGMPVPKRLALEANDRLVLPTSCVGVEVELYYKPFFTNLWESVSDGSLRGVSGVEYRFTQPMFGTDIIKALDEIDEHANGLPDLFDTDCSTHIHIDVRDMNYEQLAAFIQYWVIFEMVFFRVFAPNRINNNFCVPVSKAHGQEVSLSNLYKALIVGGEHLIFSTSGRYSALNIQSILNTGSLEFRLFNGSCDKEELLLWINSLLCLKKQALEYNGANHLRPYINLKGAALQPFMETVFQGNKDILESLWYTGVYKDVAVGIKIARTMANFRELSAATNMVNAHLLRDMVGEEEPIDLSRPYAVFHHGYSAQFNSVMSGFQVEDE